MRTTSQRLTADKLSKLSKKSGTLRSSYQEKSQITSVKIESLLRDVEASRTASVAGSLERSSQTGGLDMEQKLRMMIFQKIMDMTPG